MAVVILGYPNVGKSTLFYRLTQKKALVHDVAGTTRDILVGHTPQGLQILDVPGIEDVDLVHYAQDFFLNLDHVVPDIKYYHAVLLVFDVNHHPDQDDKDLYHNLVRFLQHSSHKNTFNKQLSKPVPVYVVVNKVEKERSKLDANKYYELGCSMFYPISAKEGLGLDPLQSLLLQFDSPEILQSHQSHQPHQTVPHQMVSHQMVSQRMDSHVVESLESMGSDGVEENDQHISTLQTKAIIQPKNTLNITIVGRPNVGKSLLLNTLLGYDRVLVQDQAGTTRDSVEADVHYKQYTLHILDTAGIRKPSRVVQKLEKTTVSMSMRGVRDAEGVLLVLDATQPLESQELRIGDKVMQYGKPILVVANKMDLLPKVQLKEYKSWLQKRLKHVMAQAGEVSIALISAKNKQGLNGMLDQFIQLIHKSQTRIGTGVLNRFVHELPSMSQKVGMPKIRYATQTSVCPQKFMLFVSHKDKVTDHYKRFFINKLRTEFHLQGFPIFLIIRGS